MSKRFLPISLALALATNLMQAHGAAGIEINPSKAMELSRDRIVDFWGRQRHKSSNTRNQRKRRKARRQAAGMGCKRAFNGN
jgi:hypothetical protein